MGFEKSLMRNLNKMKLENIGLISVFSGVVLLLLFFVLLSDPCMLVFFFFFFIIQTFSNENLLLSLIFLNLFCFTCSEFQGFHWWSFQNLNCKCKGSEANWYAIYSIYIYIYIVNYYPYLSLIAWRTLQWIKLSWKIVHPVLFEFVGNNRAMLPNKWFFLFYIWFFFIINNFFLSNFFLFWL